MNKQKYILLLHKKLTDQISVKEAAVLENWRLEDPSNDQYLQDMEQLWLSSIEYSPSPKILDTQSAKEDFFQKISQAPETGHVYSINRDKLSNTRNTNRIWLAVAASFLIIIGSFFIVRNIEFQKVPEFMQIAEPYVQLRNSEMDQMVVLPDGTQMWLNPGSKFRYEQDFNKKDRVVYLYGEMFIHVAPDANRPFIINTELNQIKVLGTSFYLKADESGEVALRVEEGLVEFSDTQKNKKLVKAGDELLYQKKSNSFREPTDQDPLVSNWRQNYLVFERVPLLNVFNKLKVFYGVEFIIDCEKVDEMDGFTSLVQQNDHPKLDVFLQTLEKVYGIQIDEIKPKTYQVFGDPCK